jgi:RNase P subunit RPR2
MRLHLPRRYRFLFCRSCGYPLTINTARIRLNNKKRQIHYQCLNCNNEQRFGFSKKD